MPARRHDWVIARRLAVQRISSAPLGSATDVVRHLACVQSQELTVAPYSVGLRTRRATSDSVIRELSDGQFVRTHILRPTWHYVAIEDLRWIQTATAPRVHALMRGRHRQLEIDNDLIGAAEKQLGALLGERALTRREIARELPGRGLELSGERLGHVLMVLELHTMICSGPVPATSATIAHTYRLVDDVAPPPAAEMAADQALRELAVRFVHGHGPVSVADFARWASLTKKQAAAAIADASDVLEAVDYDGTTLWLDPSYTPRRAQRPTTMLLPLFDEAFLTSPALQFTRPPDHPLSDDRHTWMGADPGAGVVLHDSRNVGAWSRELVGSAGVRIRLRLSPSLDADAHIAIDSAVHRYADFIARTLVG